MDYRPVLGIFTGVWADEDRTKEEGMVVGDQTSKSRVSLGKLKGAA